MRVQVSLSARPKSPKHAATAWVLVFDGSQGKFLMLKRAKKTNNPNLWNFPGGGTDGKAAVAGAKRELLEEAGIAVKKSDLQYISGSLDGTITYFLLLLPETPQLRIDPKESSKHKWMTMDEIAALGNKLHSKTSLFMAQNINRRLVNMAIRKSDLPSTT